MPGTIHSDLVTEAVKLEETSPWHWLFEVKLDDTNSLRVVQGTEQVTYDGNIYYPYPLSHDGLKSSSEDASRSLTVTAHHVDNQLRSMIHEYSGFVDKQVVVLLVHSDSLDVTIDQGGSARNELWEVTDVVEMTRDTVTWPLGFIGQYDRPTPHNRFSRTLCRHRFSGPVCQFYHAHLSDADIINTGLQPGLVRVCDHGYGTKNGCQAHRDYAIALSMDSSRWPQVYGGQRKLRSPRQ